MIYLHAAGSTLFTAAFTVKRLSIRSFSDFGGIHLMAQCRRPMLAKQLTGPAGHD